MSHFNFTHNINRAMLRGRKTQRAKQNYTASDDVHRIAMRRPTLYQSQIVPTIMPRAGLMDAEVHHE